MSAGYVLGLTGMRRRFAAALLHGDTVAFAIEEDKLRRSRGIGLAGLDSPSRAVELAVQHAGGVSRIDAVAFAPPMGADPAEIEVHRDRVRRLLESQFGLCPEVHASDHVRSHLAFERAVHADVDRVLMVGRDRAVYSPGPAAPDGLDVPFGVVTFFEQAADLLGLDSMRIHHLENMARQGEPRFFEALAPLAAAPPAPGDLVARLQQAAGVGRRLPDQPFSQVHYDLAASLVRILHHHTIELVRALPGEARAGRLALCGGVFQSWSLNDALAREFPGAQFHVSFAPGNTGCAAGAPLALTGRRPARGLGPFLGPEYSRDEIKAVLDNSKARYEFHSFSGVLDLVTAALAAGKMVGWFSGRCEFGYRALGHRSVFANPANPYASDNLSSYLKRRPAYFAYAVAAAEEAFPEIHSPYLSRSTSMPEYFGDAPVRIQTVARAAAPALYQLLGAFEKKTGVKALLNTSLNYFDEPLACTPRDALKTFYASGLDMLVMDGFVLAK